MAHLRILLLDVNLTELDTTVDMVEYPIGLLYVSTVLADAFGDQVDVRIESYNHRRDGLEGAERILREHRPDVLGLRGMTMGRDPLHAIASLAKDRCGIPFLMVGGPHASDNPHDVMANEAVDCAVIGEGERTATEVVACLLDRRPLDDLRGLAVRVSGQVRINEPRPLIQDIDELPLPDHRLVDFLGINRGQISFSFRRDVPHANLFTSRGCPYRCMYCHQLFGKRIRAHSPERVMAEVRTLHDEHGVRRFQILDDIFNLDRGRALRFFDLVVSSNLDLEFAFPNGLRGDRMDEEMVDAMWRAGVRYVCYAIETGSPRLQSLIQKHLKLDRVQEAITWTTAKGIVTRGFFMMGFPTETEEEVRQTIEFAVSSDLVLALFFTVVYFPGTPLFELARSVCDMTSFELGLEDDYVRTREGPYAFDRERLDELKIHAIKEFFFSPRRVSLAFELLPSFYTRRDLDAQILASIISAGVKESDIADPEVTRRLRTYFRVAERFSRHEGFFV